MCSVYGWQGRAGQRVLCCVVLCCRWPGHEAAGCLHSHMQSDGFNIGSSFSETLCSLNFCMHEMFVFYLSVYRHHQTVFILFVMMCIVLYYVVVQSKSVAKQTVPHGAETGTVPLLLGKARQGGAGLDSYH